ncbi:MAG: amino acid adenylation domain-containing protein, partial [Actinoplanes sp.]
MPYGETGIPAAFDRVVRSTPDAVALRRGAQTVTYRELDACAAQVAQDLVTRIEPEGLVAVCATVGIDVVTTLLGVLRAGGAYLPLDPGQPDARLAMTLRDSGVRLVLAQPQDVDRVRSLAGADTEVLPIGAARTTAARELPQPAGTALAYAMYTSGSTGRPKAVLVEQGSVVALARHGRIGIRRRDVLLQLAPLTVDPSVFEMWGALLNGATLVLPAGPRPDLHQIAELVVRHRVTVLRLAAPLLRMMAEHHIDALRAVRMLVSGGDRASVDAVRRILDAVPGCTVVNGYGPTEATVYATWHPMTRYDDAWPSVPIGTPLHDGAALVLDERLVPVPPGQIGELCVSGAGVARSYLGRPEETAARFVPHPSQPGQRVYRTGDRVRLLPDGNLEYLGRADDQVKIRGYRVELGEVEHALNDHPAVREAAVIAAAGRLTAFAVPVEAGRVTGADMRARLATVLPGHMVPSAVVVVPALPRTANGKTDRRQLAATRTAAAPAPASERLTPVQLKVGTIWKRVLQAPVIRPEDTVLSLGGDSLAALEILADVRRELHVALSLPDLLDGATLCEVADRVAGSPLVASPAAGAGGRVPLLPSQEGVWFEDRLGAPGRYNIGRTFLVRGELDEPGLRRAIRDLADRQRALRTVIEQDEDGLRQVVTHSYAPAVTTTVLRHLPYDEAERAARKLIDRAAHRRVEPGEPLVRIEVIRLSVDRWMVDVNLHHVIADDWSCSVLFDELAALYEGHVLPPLERQFADHARAAGHRPAGETLRRRFAGYPGPYELPADLSRPATPTGNGAVISLELDAEVTGAAAEAARRHGVSRFMVALAAVHIVLSRYAERDDLAIGVPVAGRGAPGADALIGYFVTMTLARINPAPEATVPDLMRQVREVCLELYRQDDVPVHELAAAAGLAGSPVFQAVVNYQQRANGTLRLGDTDVTEVAPPPRTSAKFDLSFGFREVDDRIAVDIEFSTDVFRADTVRQLGEHLSNTLRWLTTHPAGRLREAELASPAASGGLTPAPADMPEGPLHNLVRAQAARCPDRVAVVGEHETLTYRELDDRSDRVAAALHAAGQGPGSRVAVCLERSPDLLVALLGVLKTGAAYVPLDPSYPRDRLMHVLADAQASLVVSGDEPVGEPGAVSFVGIRQLLGCDGPVPEAHDADAPAYVIYTSGSTGRPRGVVVTHRAVLNTLYGNLQRHDFRADDVWLQTTSPGFDVAAYEQFMPLLSGAALVYCSDACRADRAAFTRFVARHGITVLVCVPSFLRALEQPELPSLRILLVAGEPADVRDTRHFAATTTVINGYGPTEAAILATTYEATADDDRTRVPIGPPLPGTSGFVLDRFGRLAPDGVPGELWLGGAGLAAGYWNNEAATADRFGTVPVLGDQRLYRTGDRVRRLPDGSLDYLGRLDDQVKLRGFRIEPAEIEAALARHPEVAEAAVVLAGTGDAAELVAFVVGHADVDAGELRAHLARRLPKHMVPARFVDTPRIPTNGNGKTDRRELARRAGRSTVERHRAAAAPLTAVAQQVVDIWSTVLDAEISSLAADFFDVGGHSLRLIRLLARVEQATGVAIALRDFLAEPTVGAMVRRIEGGPAADARPA